MAFKMTPAKIVVFSLMAFMAILWLNDMLSTSWLAVFIVAIAVLLLWDSSRRVQITLMEAREKSYKTMKELQRRREIADGDLKLLPESELKNLIVHGGEKTSIEPEKYDILFEVGSSRNIYYLVKMSIYGDWIGITSPKRARAIGMIEDEYRDLGAAPIYTERMATAGERTDTSGPPRRE